MRDIDLPKSLKLGEQRLQDNLNMLILQTEEFWGERTLLSHFTNHGIDHSIRIIGIIDNLLEQYPNLLNDFERFILISSVFLHDIGMELPTYAGLELKSDHKYTLEEMDTIREYHNDSSSKMILDAINNDIETPFNLTNCKNLVPYIAEVSKYHRKCVLSELSDVQHAGKKIRLSLLAAILRLSDELDCDFRRSNLNFLKYRDIPIESKFHWWTHHFVESIAIVKGRIELYFRYPEQQRDKNEILLAFKKKILESIKATYHQVYDILDSHGVRLYKDVIPKEAKFKTKGELELIPVDLLEYMETKILNIESKLSSIKKDGLVFHVDGIPYSNDEETKKCLTIVSGLLIKGNYKDALEHLKKCLLFTMTPKDKMIFLNMAGFCHYILGNLDLAMEMFNDSLFIADRADIKLIYNELSFSLKASVLNNLGILHLQIGNMKTAFDCFTDSINIFSEIPATFETHIPYLNLSTYYIRIGDYNKAQENIKKAISISKKSKSIYGFFESQHLIGTIHMILGEFSKAEKIFIKILNGLRKIEDPNINPLIFQVNTDLAAVLTSTGEIENAVKLYNELLDYSKRNNQIENEVLILYLLGTIALEIGNNSLAKDYFDESLVKAIQITNPALMANIYMGLGSLLIKTLDLKNAKQFLEKSLEITLKLKRQVDIAFCYELMASMYIIEKDFAVAKEYLIKASQIANELKLIELEAKILGDYGIIYGLSNEDKIAIEYFDKAIELYRKISSRKINEQYIAKVIALIQLGQIKDSLKLSKKTLVYIKNDSPIKFINYLKAICDALLLKNEIIICINFLNENFAYINTDNQFNNYFDLILRLIRLLIHNKNWKGLKEINLLSFKSKNKSIESLLDILTNYALCKIYPDEKIYEEQFKKLLKLSSKDSIERFDSLIKEDI